MAGMAADVMTSAIALPERLTMSDASATLARLAPLLQAASAPVIDAAPLHVLDTAALAVLLACQRQAHARGLQLAVTGAPPKLAQLARLYGVEALLGLEGAVVAAAQPAVSGAGGRPT